MLQQVMTEPGKIEFHEVPVPEISDREVLIKFYCFVNLHNKVAVFYNNLFKSWYLSVP